MQRHDNICNSLNALQDQGIIRSWLSQSGTPGKRYTVETSALSTYAFDTKGAEDFILGAKAVLFL
jgi:hypothetical protein